MPQVLSRPNRTLSRTADVDRERVRDGTADDLTPEALASEALTTARGAQPRSGFWLNLTLTLRGILLRLADWVVPADTAMTERAAGMVHTQIAGLLARHRIPDLLREGPLDAGALAAMTGTNADAMHRILRAATTAGVGKMLPDGRFANNHLSLALCSDQPGRVREFAEYFSSASNCAAYGELDYVLKTGREGFAHAHQQDMWQWFDAHPQERETFAQLMTGITLVDAPMVAKLYPFDEIRSLCDLGGGRGAMLSELVLRYPHLQGLLVDSEGVIESAKSLLAARGVTDRVQVQSGDFFASVPGGYDAYMLKNILHDWSDEQCKILLRNCRKVMSSGSRLLVVEIILEKNDRHNFASFRDLHLLTTCNGGRERGLGEYRDLLESVGFSVGRVSRSPIVSVIEGVVG